MQRHLFSDTFEPERDTPVLNMMFDEVYAQLARRALTTWPRARVRRTTNQTGIVPNTQTAVVFDASRYDTGKLWSSTANPSRLTAPQTGLYAIGGSVRWSASVAAPAMHLRVNGSTVVASANAPVSTGSTKALLTASTEYLLTAGDYLELVVDHASSGNATIETAAAFSPELFIRRVA